MNLQTTLSIYAGGLGSGCNGPNCGRPSGDFVYHTTHTKNVAKIEEKGLLPMQTSNWVHQGNRHRYGKGEVYVFENQEDAVRWAAKMDWTFNHSTGTGKVSIVKVKTGDTPWKEDQADPLSQAQSKGRWFKFMGRIPAEQVVSSEPLTLDMVRKLVAR